MDQSGQRRFLGMVPEEVEGPGEELLGDCNGNATGQLALAALNPSGTFPEGCSKWLYCYYYQKCNISLYKLIENKNFKLQKV